MLEVRKSEERFAFEIDWLRTYWSFSFDQYYDPKHVSFGALRVFNEDFVQPSRGFDMHPHRDMEIVTYVLSGAIEHQDDTGGHGVIRPGDVQVMSAGTGIVHSEKNPLAAELTHLLQVWILPDRRGHRPRYDQRNFGEEARRGRILPVASGRGGRGVPGALEIHQDATYHVGRVEPGSPLSHSLEATRLAYLHVVKGAIDLDGTALGTGDAAKISGVSQIRIAAAEPTEVVLIDLPPL